MAQNLLVHVPSLVYAPKLSSLNLTANWLTFDSSSFSPTLKRLELSFITNPILFEGTLALLVHLDTLLLNGNGLTLIEKRALSDLVALRELNLENNKLSKLNDGTFASLGQLGKLLLGSNRFESFADANLEYLVNLETLDLSNNLIMSVGAGDLAAFGARLKALNLSNNRVKVIHAEAFATLSRLESFRFAQNELAFFELSSMLNVNSTYASNKNVYELDLSANSIVIDDVLAKAVLNIYQFKYVNLRRVKLFDSVDNNG